jgi:hypothetical protein
LLFIDRGSQALLPSSFFALAASPGATLVAIQASGTGARLVLVQVHLARLAVHELALSGEPEIASWHRSATSSSASSDPFFFWYCAHLALRACLAQVDIGIEVVCWSPTPLCCRLERQPAPADRLLGSLRLCIGEPLRGAAIALALTSARASVFFLSGPEDHQHVPAVLLRRRLDEAELVDIRGQLLQEVVAELGPRLLASPEHDRDLDLVAPP